VHALNLGDAAPHRDRRREATALRAALVEWRRRIAHLDQLCPAWPYRAQRGWRSTTIPSRLWDLDARFSTATRRFERAHRLRAARKFRTAGFRAWKRKLHEAYRRRTGKDTWYLPTAARECRHHANPEGE